MGSYVLRRGLILCCAALGCATPPASAPPATPAAPAPSAAPTLPDFFTKALTREAEPGPEREVLGPEGSFKAKVRSQGVEISPAETYVRADFDIGAESKATCFLYPDNLDTATSMVVFSNRLFDNLAKGGTFDGKQLQRLDVAVRGRSPLFVLNWLYRVKQEGRPIIGQLKLRVASHDQKGVICFHDEVGFEKTFERLVSELLDTLVYADSEEVDAYFLEVARVTLAGTPVGFALTTYTRQEEGTLIDSRTSLAIPVGPGELQYEDSVSIELSEADGALVARKSVESSAGELTRNLDLARDDGGIWRVSGTLKEKEIQAELGTEPRPISSLGQALSVRDALAKSGGSAAVDWLVWSPEADPTSFQSSQVKIEAKSADGSFSGSMTLGPLQARVVFLPDGTSRRAELDAAGQPLVIERVHAEGKL